VSLTRGMAAVLDNDAAGRQAQSLLEDSGLPERFQVDPVRRFPPPTSTPSCRGRVVAASTTAGSSVAARRLNVLRRTMFIRTVEAVKPPSRTDKHSVGDTTPPSEQRSGSTGSCGLWNVVAPGISRLTFPQPWSARRAVERRNGRLSICAVCPRRRIVSAEIARGRPASALSAGRAHICQYRAPARRLTQPPLEPRCCSALQRGGIGASGRWPRPAGGPPGSRTLNPRGKSPLLWPVELAALGQTLRVRRSLRT
jgi:hypothetical protein